ncbi:energy transducer TonB [Flavobacterium sp.]|uniref:energy transducer TonB n=2 Tax=Flavobacterium sp. TaxID=239 RepID=UPI0040487FDD
MKKTHIAIPTPCNENWDRMLPEDKGRFCQLCAKTVVDFTNSSPEEITDYFIKNKESKTCGRFKKEQLNSIHIEIPKNIIYQQTSFKNVFMLALLISMGTTLFSCKDHNNNVHPVDKIVLVDDSLSSSNDSVLSSSIQKKEGIDNNKIQKSAPVLLGVVEVDPKHEEFMMGDVIQEPVVIDTINVYGVSQVEKKPEFPGGEIKFNKYIIDNLELSEPLESELILVQFVINTKGIVEEIKVVKGQNKEVNAQLIRLLQNSPLWTPAEIQDEKVKVKMIYPIRIKSQ